MPVVEKPCILVVDDDFGCRRAVLRLLRAADIDCVGAEGLAEAKKIIAERKIAAVVSELRLPDGLAVEVLEMLRERDPYIGRIVLTGNVDFQAVQEVVNRAAPHGFFTKPWDNESLSRGVLGVLERCRLERENAEMASYLRDQNVALEALVRSRTAALEKAKRELQSLFDAFEFPLALVGKDFLVLRANSAWASACGLDVREVPGKTCYQALLRLPAPCPLCPMPLISDKRAQGEAGPWVVTARVVGLDKPAFLCQYVRKAE